MVARRSSVPSAPRAIFEMMEVALRKGNVHWATQTPALHNMLADEVEYTDLRGAKAHGSCGGPSDALVLSVWCGGGLGCVEVGGRGGAWRNGYVDDELLTQPAPNQATLPVVSRTCSLVWIRVRTTMR